jgi:hypothetical protein
MKHVVHIVKARNAFKFLVLKTQGLDNFKTWTDDVKLLISLNWLSIGSIYFCEQSDEFCRTHSKEFLYQLNYLSLFKEHSIPSVHIFLIHLDTGFIESCNC